MSLLVCIVIKSQSTFFFSFFRMHACMYEQALAEWTTLIAPRRPMNRIL